YPGPFEYHMTRISDQGGLAITNMEPGKRGTRAYFAVDDINAGAARVRELGGEVDQPAPVPGMGWFVTAKDPQGNEFGLWQKDPSAPAPAGYPRLDPPPGRRSRSGPGPEGGEACVSLYTGRAASAATSAAGSPGPVRRCISSRGAPTCGPFASGD